MSASQRRLLGLCFFLSGASGLILQVAWSKELSYLLGNTLYAVATVVAAFMGGLGLGSALASRWGGRFANPLKAYAAMEACIAFLGAASVPVLRSLGGTFSAFYAMAGEHHALFLLMRFLLVFAVTALPATLMGMTLPVVAGAPGRREERYEREAGWLYGVNTLGAVAGTLLAGFALLPMLGLFKSCLAAAAVQSSVAALAWAMGRRVGAIEDVRARAGGEKAVPAHAWTPAMRLIGGVYALSGAAALVWEVAWFRLLALTFGPSVHAFSVMLGVYLAGLGLGSMAAARLAARLRSPMRCFAAFEAALALSGLAGMALVNFLPTWYFDLFRWWHAGPLGVHGYMGAQSLTAAALVLVPTFLMGMLFPVGVRAFREAAGGVAPPEEAVGRLYALNTLGAIAGSLAAGFWLLPGLGLWRTMLLAAALSLSLALLLWRVRADGALPQTRFGFAAPGAAMVLFVIGWILLPPMDLRRANLGLYQISRADSDPSSRQWLSSFDAHRLLFYREGLNSGVALFRTATDVSLHISGKPEASTVQSDVVSQLFFGFMPLLFAPEPRDAALVGYGGGTSAGALLRSGSLQSLDAIEIERGVLDASPYFEHVNGSPLSDSRTRIVVEDGRIHLTYTGRRYDIISSEPSNPWMAGVANLFTADFYGAAKARLKPGGVFCQWLQLYQIDGEALSAMLGTLRHSFRHVHVFFAGYGDLVCIASDSPIEMGWPEVRQRLEEPSMAEMLRLCGMAHPSQLSAHYLGTAEHLLERLPKAPVITDDNAWLEHRMASLFLAQGPGVQTEVSAGVFVDPRRSLSGVPWADFDGEEHLSEIVPYAFHVNAGLGNRWTEFFEAQAPPEEAGRWKRLEAWHAQIERLWRNIPEGSSGASSLWAGRVLELEDLDPSFPAWRLLRFQAFMRLGRREDMSGELLRLEMSGQRDAMFAASIERARMAAADGSAALAWRHYRRALSLNPSPVATYEEASAPLRESGDAEAWKFFLEKAERYHPGHPLLAEWRKSAPAR
jgi:spermidine synthase